MPNAVRSKAETVTEEYLSQLTDLRILRAKNMLFVLSVMFILPILSLAEVKLEGGAFINIHFDFNHPWYLLIQPVILIGLSLYLLLKVELQLGLYTSLLARHAKTATIRKDFIPQVRVLMTSVFLVIVPFTLLLFLVLQTALGKGMGIPGRAAVVNLAFKPLYTAGIVFLCIRFICIVIKFLRIVHPDLFERRARSGRTVEVPLGRAGQIFLIIFLTVLLILGVLIMLVSTIVRF